MKISMYVLLFFLTVISSCKKEKPHTSYSKDLRFTWDTTGYNYDSLSTTINTINYASVDTNRKCDIVGRILTTPSVDSIVDINDLRIDVDVKLINGTAPILQIWIIDPYGSYRTPSTMHYLSDGKQTIYFNLPNDIPISKGYIWIFIYNYNENIDNFIPYIQTYSLKLRVRNIKN